MDWNLQINMSPALIFGLIAALVVVVIFALRSYLSSESKKALSSKPTEDPKSYSTGRKKYSSVDVFSLRGPVLSFSLLLAISFIVFAFNWTEKAQAYEDVGDMFVVDEIIEMETPRTAEPPPPPPPPPPPVIEEVPDEVEIEEEIEFVDNTITEETVVEAPKVEAAPPPPPPPPPKKKAEKIFAVVEDAPMFPGCEKEKKADRKSCADSKLFKYLSENLEYPVIARENGITGRVIITFVVEKDGSITDVKVLRGIGGGCDEVAQEVIEGMPKWNPGKQRGRPVRVQFTLPVAFTLQ